MSFFDIPLEELLNYKPEIQKPADFDTFWQNTLKKARQHPLNPRFEAFDANLKLIDVFDTTFAGFGGQDIKGWMILPAKAEEKLPCVVEYIGYGGGRGSPIDWLALPSAGYALFVMDTRGQGYSWQRGDTPDIEGDSANPHYPGFMTRGVLSPETYYYRRVFTDAVRAIETVKRHPSVDANRIAVSGESQGGGITLAVAGLSKDVKVAMPSEPFLCHYRRATQLVDTAPYNEITNYLKIYRNQVERVFQTLAYFDGVNFAPKASAKALFSTALMDTVCPPSTVFAAYNHYAGPKDIKVYEYNDHEGGGTLHVEEKIKFLKEILPV